MTSAVAYEARPSFEVRREHINLEGGGDGARLLYASDLHLRFRDLDRAERILQHVRDEVPDAVLLGGDLIDSPRGHELLAELIRELAAIAPVLAVPGNHDDFWGLRQVRSAVRSHGVWLPDTPVLVPTQRGSLSIEGRVAPRTDRLKGIPRILCGHDPAVFPSAAEAGYSLVLAGHLHGGQVVLAARNGLLYPGAFVYPWCGLRFRLGTSTMIVSRGVGDTIPLRVRCPRELILCEVRCPSHE